MQETERVPLSEVRDLIVVGDALPFRVFDDAARLLLNQGQVLASDRQFEQLIERGAWAERPCVEQVRQARADACSHANAPVQRQPTLFDLWERAIWDLDHVNRRLVDHRASIGELVAIASRVQELTDRDPDIALFGCVRQDDRRFALYALVHGLHCAVVLQLSARQLGWAADRTTCVVAAALTMNAPITELQAVLAEQKDPPSARQRELLRSHPDAAVAMLRAAGVVDARWLEAVRDHHEQPGGGGYPRGAADIGEEAQLLRIADVYMAKISPRAARPAIPPQLAARQLFQQMGQSPLAMSLVRSLGAHPPGALVQLASGEVAVVSHRARAGAAPRVATLTNRKGQPVTGTEHRDSADPGFAVTAPLLSVPGIPRVLPERIYGMVLA